MLKKIGIFLGVLIVLSVGLIYWQGQKIEQKIQQFLSENRIAVQDIELQLFPLPKFTVKSFHYTAPDVGKTTKVRWLFLENLALTSNFASLITFEPEIESIQFQNGKLLISENPKEEYLINNITVNPTKLGIAEIQDWLKWKEVNHSSNTKNKPWHMDFAIDVVNPNQQQFIANGQFQFSNSAITFKELQLQFITQSIRSQLFAQNGQVKWLDSNFSDFQIDLYQTQFNQEPFGDIHGRLFVEPESYQLKLINSECQNCSVQGYYQPRKNHFYAQANQFPVEQVLQALNYPKVIQGMANFELELHFVSLQNSLGKLTFSLPQGKFNGLNLLAIASQYLPINYDEALLNKSETPVQDLVFQAQLINSQVEVEKADFNTKELQFTSQGNIDLINKYCDFSLKLASTQQKYKALKLPLRIYDRCDSPKYKVEMNRQFRNQLKQYLKDKFQ